MKRVDKLTNRKGFTLVETLLATFILVVISTMLINGFIATMGYSYQTSVYSKSGANNYAACMERIAKHNRLPDRGNNSRQSMLGNNSPSTKELTFVCPGSYKLEGLTVEVVSEYTLDNTVPGTLPFQSADYAPKDGNHYGSSDELVDNRKSIVYYPEYWRASADSSKYKIAIRVDYTTTDSSGNPKYEWVVLPTYEVADDYDLSGLASSDVIGQVGGAHRTFGGSGGGGKPTGQ
jgi:prepilin-type N-terminal cleavage/methylation domain-containing protein